MNNSTTQRLSASTRLKSIISGSAGNLVEWYDWYAYSAFSIYFAPVFFPKGEVAKVQGIENTLAPFSFAIPKAVTAICEETLIGRFAELKPLGKCYLDERLKNYPVPFSQRSASKALRTIVRGSKIPLPEANVIRFFIWWKNGKYRTDMIVPE